MSYFPPDFIAQVRAANDIVDVISEYVELMPAGNVYKGICPFPHAGNSRETEPSFTVYPETQSFYCYGCGKGSRSAGSAGSDVIAFIMEIEHLTFPQAVTYLAERAGISLPASDDDNAVRKFIEANKQRLEYYQSSLFATKEALDYLYSRPFPINDDMIRKYALGFVPYNDRRKRARGRIAIPIMSVSSNPYPVAFVYRSIDGSEPKFCNDPNNPPFYEKGKHLYLLSHAFQGIRSRGFAIIVEGYFDAIALHECGVTNTVALGGLNMTDAQLNLLARYTDQVCLWFDGDEAGTNAVFRLLPQLLERGFFVSLVKSSMADPDEICALLGPSRIDEYIANNSVPAVQYFLDQQLQHYDAVVYQEKRKLLQTIMPILNSIKNQNDRVLFMSQLADRLGLSSIYNMC